MVFFLLSKTPFIFQQPSHKQPAALLHPSEPKQCPSSAPPARAQSPPSLLELNPLNTRYRPTHSSPEDEPLLSAERNTAFHHPEARGVVAGP